MWQVTISRHQMDPLGPATTAVVSAMTVNVSERYQLLGIEDAVRQAFDCHNWTEPRVGCRLEVHAHRYTELLASADHNHEDDDEYYDDEDEEYDDEF